MAFEVRVVNEDDRGVEGVSVVLSFGGATRGPTEPEYTDADGYAVFDAYDDGDVTVYLNGADYGRHHYQDGEAISITQ